MNSKSFSLRVALFLCLICGSTLLAQDSTSYSHKGKKSKVVAVVLSYIPGLGHVYAERPLRGLGFCAGGLATYYVALAYAVSQGDDRGSTGAGVAIIGAIIAMKAWEVIDLLKCVDEHNKKSLSMGIIPNGQKSCAIVLQYRF